MMRKDFNPEEQSQILVHLVHGKNQYNHRLKLAKKFSSRHLTMWGHELKGIEFWNISLENWFITSINSAYQIWLKLFFHLSKLWLYRLSITSHFFIPSQFHVWSLSIFYIKFIWQCNGLHVAMVTNSKSKLRLNR